MDPAEWSQKVHIMQAYANDLDQAMGQQRQRVADMKAQLEVQEAALASLRKAIDELQKVLPQGATGTPVEWDVPHDWSWKHPCVTKANWYRFEKRPQHIPSPPYGYHKDSSCPILKRYELKWPDEGIEWFRKRRAAWKPCGQCLQHNSDPWAD